MRAILLEEHGGPEVLRPADLPVPTPGRHQLLVRVRATSVNPVDIKVRRGGGASRPKPIVLGYDASGVVKACGPDTGGWREGDRVFGCPNVHYEFMGARVASDLEPGRQGAILSSIANLVDRALLRPHVSALFPLDRLAEAHRQIETGHTVGKVAVAVA